MEKKLDKILSVLQEHSQILQEHSQLLRTLEHRTEVTGSEVKAIKEEMHYLKGEAIKLDNGQKLLKEDQLALLSCVDNNHTEVKEKLNDLDEKMDYVLLNVARHEAKLLAKKKLP